MKKDEKNNRPNQGGPHQNKKKEIRMIIDNSEDSDESEQSIGTQVKTMMQSEKNKGTQLINIQSSRLEQFRKARQMTDMQKSAAEFSQKQTEANKIKTEERKRKGIFVLLNILYKLKKKRFLKYLIQNRRKQKKLQEGTEIMTELLLSMCKKMLMNQLKENRRKQKEEEDNINKLKIEAQKKKNAPDVKSSHNEEEKGSMSFKQDGESDKKNKPIKKITIVSKDSMDENVEQLKKQLEKEKAKVLAKENLNKELEMQKKLLEEANEKQKKAQVEIEQVRQSLANEKLKSEEMKQQVEREKEAKRQRELQDKEVASKNNKDPLKKVNNSETTPLQKRQQLNMFDADKKQTDLIEEDKSIEIIQKPKDNNINMYGDQAESYKKVEQKSKKLKQKLQIQNDYLNRLHQAMQKKQEEIDNINNQIVHQQIKSSRIQEGEPVSLTASLVSSVDEHTKITRGCNIIHNFFNQRLRKIFGKPKGSKFAKKMTHRLDGILSTKHKEEREMLFREETLEGKTPLMIPKRKTKKENTGRQNDKWKIDLIQSDNEDQNNSFGDLHDFPRKSTKKKTMKKQTRPGTVEQQKEENEDTESQGENTNRKVTLNLDDVYTEETYYDMEEDDEEDNQLLEYDKFYKEDFFKDEMFKSEEKDNHDLEEEEIKRETARSNMKRKIKSMEKEKEMRMFKGLDTIDIDAKIKILKEDYTKKKITVPDHIELQMNNTDALLYKGRLLFNYFNGEKKKTDGIPKFSVECEKDVKGKEIIQFKSVGKEEKARRYFDRCPCLDKRKKMYKWLSYTKHYCNLLVDNKWFEFFSLCVIIVNTILILISEPTDPNNIANTSDSYFLYFYTLEAILKILAFGFICEEFAYLKDYWNILDFIVIFVGWISFILEKGLEGQKISGLSGLRAFRILRPLKTVKSIKGLKNLVVALLASVMKLADTTIVLVFFYLIFAIGGVQMWSGLFLKRCMSLNFGYLRDFDSFKSMCTFDSDCEHYNEPGNRYICIKGFLNPNGGYINFDNTLMGFVTIFVVTTMEGWTTIFEYVSRTFKDKFYINPIIIFFYFHVLLFIGGYYLVNLFLAVTNSEFTKVETERKEAMSKKSFFLLIKSKYDLKEKEKQEKKKKERELKLKNQDKNGESLRDLKYRIKDEAFHIRKNINDIPINYETVKDLYIFQNDNPEELYKMDGMIHEEEKYLKKDIERQVKKIDQIIAQNKIEKKIAKKANSMLKKTGATEHDESKHHKRKITALISRPIEKMHPPAIELCISYTQQWLKDEMVNLQKVEAKRTDTADLLKQKIEKKELEKFNKEQVSIKEDLSFEKDRKKKKDDLPKHSYVIPKTKMSSKVGTARNSQLLSKQILNDINQKRNHKRITDELSFMTDLSGIADNEMITEHNDDSVDTMSNQNNHYLTSIDNADNEICARKRTALKDDYNLYQEIAFNNPGSILPALLQLKNDTIVQKKIEIMRNKFNVNDFLIKAAKQGDNINNIGRRRSFLDFMQFPQEKENLASLFNTVTDRSEGTKSNLDISLYNNEDKLSFYAKSFSDLDILSDEVPENNVVFDENFDFEELNTKIESNRYASMARKSILNQTGKGNKTSNQDFYSDVNLKMTSNIKIDLKEPRGRGPKQLTRSHIFMDLKNIQPNEDAEIKETKELKSIQTSQTHQKKKKAYLYKSPSIEKNLSKYPVADTRDLIVDEENKRKEFENITADQEMVPMNLRTRKYYMNYLFNIKDKDLKVKDDFKVDTWKTEVMGTERKLLAKKKLPESKEAVFVFNNKSLNLKKYKYIMNKKFEYMENEYAILTHHLTNLPINILELMPPRVRDFGRYSIGKDINLGALSTMRSGMKSTKSGFKFSQSTFSSSAINRSKSVLCIGSTFSNSHRYLDDVKYKKGFYEKIYKKIDDFNYKTLYHYLLEDENLYFKLTDEKRREEKEKELEDIKKSKDGVIEVKGEVRSIRIFDLRTNSRRYILWSGQDVLYKKDPDTQVTEWNNLMYNLENFNVIIWYLEGPMKIIIKIRYGLYLISINQWVDYIIMLLVVANAIIMALDGNMFTPEEFKSLSVSNYVFNSIFIAEFVVKFFGLGPIVYFSDAFTYLDMVIIAFAILDMAVDDTGNTDEIGGKKSVTSQLSFLRVFRIFRVLRLTKILRRMKSMRLIIVSIKKSLANVAYIVLILIMFILIFQLLGMSILSGDKLYQSFMPAFYVTFQVLTIENWDGVLVEMMTLSPLVFFYYMIWIFIGNYILFNLFISILLQSFEGDEHDEDDEDEDDIIEKRFGLPEYFGQLKSIEKEHKNRLKEAKSRKNVAKTHTRKNSTSNSTSRMNNSSVNMSASSANNTSASSMTQEETETLSDEESDSRILTGVDKTLNEWRKLNYLYRKNECEYAFYIIKQHNPFRMWCMKLQSMKRFDTFILIMILLSTARLILDTFIAGYISVLVFDIADMFFTWVFLFEMFIKVIALGLVMDEGTYLRDNWNKIDLVIAIVSIIDFQALVSKYTSESSGNSSLNFLKVLRLLRTLRPLRFISHNVQLKLIITSLFDSILPICNALFIVLIVFFMFSIVGMNLFYNLYHNCFIKGKTTDFEPADLQFATNLANKNIANDAVDIQAFCSETYNGLLDTGPNFKFSNIFISLMTSYVLGNMEGWPDIMNSYRVFDEFYGLFFVVYLLVVSYFFLNLFTGIMFKYFNLAWSREKKINEDDKHAEKYYDFLKQIQFAEPEYNSFYCPKVGSLRHYLFRFVNSKIFDNFIMIIILLNLVTMAINFDYSPPLFSSILDDVNIGFTAIFIGECLLKILALGPSCYFFFGWNKFDFFVVLASIVDLIFLNIDDIDASFLKSFQIIRVLRVLRVTRVLRLVKSLKGLEKLLQTLRWSVTALMNVFILMFLIFCIFAILGCYLYDGVNLEKYGNDFVFIDEYYNFDNFYFAFLLVFRCATGEAWPMLMLDLAYIDENKVSANQAFIYMIVMNFISAVIMLNLFLMVTLQQYDEFTNKTYNPVEKFEDFAQYFKRAWNKHSSSKDKGYRLKKLSIPNFFLDFTWKKLQFPENNKIEHIKKYISELKLRTDQENYVYFYDVLFKVIAKQLGSKIDRLSPANSVIFKEEKKLSEEIKRKINAYILKNEINKNKLNNPLGTFNPLTSHLYFKISYLYLKTFINYYKENAETYMNEEMLLSKNDSRSIDDEDSDSKSDPIIHQDDKSPRKKHSNLIDDDDNIKISDNNINSYGNQSPVKREKSHRSDLSDKFLNHEGRESEKLL